MENLLKDVRYTLRLLWKSPVFTLAAVLSIALGIGVNTTIFSLVNAVLLRPLPVTRPGELVEVYTSSDNDEIPYATSSYPDYLDFARENAVLTGLAGHSLMFAPVTRDGRSEILMGEIVTANYFDVLGVGAVTGRTFAPDEGAPGAKPVAVIGYGLWQREYGGDPSAVGRSIRLRGIDYTIVGVAPKAFEGMTPGFSPLVWVTAAMMDEVSPVGMIDTVPSPGRTRLEQRGWRWMFLTGRLKPGVTAEAGAGEPERDRGAARARVPGLEPRPEDHGRRARRRARQPAGRRQPLGRRDAADGRRGPRAPHRLRQRREPAAGARDGAAPRDRRAAGDWRRARAARPPAPHREPRAVGARRPRRPAVRVGQHGPAPGAAAAAALHADARPRPRPARVPVRAPRRRRVGRGLRPRARPPGLVGEPRHEPQGRRRRRGAHGALPAAPGPGGRAGDRLDGAARGRRPVRAQPGRRAHDRPRLRPAADRARLDRPQDGAVRRGEEPPVLPRRARARARAARRGGRVALAARAARPEHQQLGGPHRRPAVEPRAPGVHHRLDHREPRLLRDAGRADPPGARHRGDRHGRRAGRGRDQRGHGEAVLAGPQPDRAARAHDRRRHVRDRRRLGRLQGAHGRARRRGRTSISRTRRTSTGTP